MKTDHQPGSQSAVTAPPHHSEGHFRLDLGAAATALAAALLIVYLSLENGGYDPIPRGEVGIAIWWALLVTVGVGVLPVPGRTRVSFAALGLLLGFAVWTGLAVQWTESVERTVTELVRNVTYLGFLALGISLVTRRREAARPLLGGITLGLGTVAVLGALSRMKLGWFPENEIGTYLPGIEIERRLAYPLNYSSAVGIMAGMALPLLLAAAHWPRAAIARIAAAAALPLAGLALYLATSGSGVGAALVGIAVLLVLVPDRILKLITLIAAAGGTAVLARAVDQREALDRGLVTPAAEQQGNEVLLVAVVVCAILALIQLGLDHAQRARPPWLYISRSRAQIATVVAILIALPLAIGAGLPGEASERWQTFKGREGSDAGPSSSATIVDFSGSGRYEFWVSAVDAGQAEPLTGIGPGTFEFWWARNGTYAGFIRDAHSLYLESLGELGIPGLLLITGFMALILLGGLVRALRASPEERVLLAAATAACAAFAFGAALDWVWEIAALPVAFMLLAAVALSGFSRHDHGLRRRRSRQRRRNRIQRVVVAVAAIVALAVTWHSLRAEKALEQSRIEYASGDLSGALSEARTAADHQPYAASPRIQQALILEQQGRLDRAAAAARLATAKERTNWRTWLVLARLEARSGNLDEALSAYERARALNPRSGLF